MKPKNGYLWVKPIEEESTFKVDEENYCFVELLDHWLNNNFTGSEDIPSDIWKAETGVKLIVKNLELYCVKQEKHYFVHESNVVAIYEPPA